MHHLGERVGVDKRIGHFKRISNELECDENSQDSISQDECGPFPPVPITGAAAGTDIVSKN
jgi:hypothetical protein